MSIFNFSGIGKGKNVSPLAKSAGQQINDLSKSVAAPAKTAKATTDKADQSESTFSLSKEAMKLLEEKREADRERIRKAAQEMTQKMSGLAEAQKNSKQSALNQKISDAKERLKNIVEMMRTALLMGDKRLAAALAKDAAQIAKDLAAAIRAAGGGGPAGTGEAVPQVIADGEPQEGAEQTEGGENLSLEVAEASNTPDAPDAEEAQGEAEATEAEAKARAAEMEAGAAAKETEDGEDKGEGEDGKNDIADKKEKLAELLEKAKNEVKVRLAEMASKAMTGGTQEARWGLTPDQKKSLEEIKSLLKSIMSMAKTVLKRDSKPIGAVQSASPLDKKAAKDVEDADKDIDDAIEDIDEAIQESV